MDAEILLCVSLTNNYCLKKIRDIEEGSRRFDSLRGKIALQPKPLAKNEAIPRWWNPARTQKGSELANWVRNATQAQDQSLHPLTVTALSRFSDAKIGDLQQTISILHFDKSDPELSFNACLLDTSRVNKVFLEILREAGNAGAQISICERQSAGRWFNSENDAIAIDPHAVLRIHCSGKAIGYETLTSIAQIALSMLYQEGVGVRIRTTTHGEWFSLLYDIDPEAHGDGAAECLWRALSEEDRVTGRWALGSVEQQVLLSGRSITDAAWLVEHLRATFDDRVFSGLTAEWRESSLRGSNIVLRHFVSDTARPELSYGIGRFLKRMAIRNKEGVHEREPRPVPFLPLAYECPEELDFHEDLSTTDPGPISGRWGFLYGVLESDCVVRECHCSNDRHLRVWRPRTGARDFLPFSIRCCESDTCLRSPAIEGEAPSHPGPTDKNVADWVKTKWKWAFTD